MLERIKYDIYNVNEIKIVLKKFKAVLVFFFKIIFNNHNPIINYIFKILFILLILNHNSNEKKNLYIYIYVCIYKKKYYVIFDKIYLM